MSNIIHKITAPFVSIFKKIHGYDKKHRILALALSLIACVLFFPLGALLMAIYVLSFF